MSKFVIKGGKPLTGTIAVSGSKNAALKALAAALILDGETVIDNVPDIEDIHRLVEIIKDLGVTVTRNGSSYALSGDIKKSALHPQLHQKLRASVMLAGPVLLRTGEVDFPYPGGCVIGKRPIDFFIQGFRALGVEVKERQDGFTLSGKNLRGAKIVFPRPSVMGTEALMTFATRVPGTTTLVNAAMEPEIPALAEFLNASGAKISGAGTSTIVIEGVDQLNGGRYVTMPDRIEAGTFVILGAATKSHITVTGLNPGHLEVFWEYLRRAGVKFTIQDSSVEVLSSKDLLAIEKDIVTNEYPGLATDLQPPLTLLMTQAKGNSLVTENIHDGRLFYADALNSMGANILMTDPRRVLVMGPTPLYGRRIASPDLRAGIALVIAGLVASGTTEIDNVYQIDRGYENIEKRLQELGADIKRVE